MAQEVEWKEFFEEQILTPVIKFYNKYQNIILGVLGAIVLIIVFTIITITRLQQTQKRNWEKISLAQSYIYNKMYVEGFKLLDEIINTSKNSKYSAYAMYIKASFLTDELDNSDYATAKDLCLKILELKKPKTLLPHTLYLLGQCYQNLGDFTNAVKTYNEFISKYPNHFLTPRVYESLAITYDLAGDKENVKNIYDKINILYPGSYWSSIAQKKLNPTISTQKN
jgi:tetratricopeptide (TPR) repeat protein